MARTRSRAVAAAVLALLSLGLPAQLHGSPCERTVAVGDLHGSYEGLVKMLEATGLVDDDLRWTGRDACLVQTGDVVDRGPRSREILDLLMDLERQAPDRVFVLLGNHEVMTLVGSLGYVAPEEFAEFAEDETPEQRQAGFAEFLKAHGADAVDEAELLVMFREDYPPGWFARKEAFSPRGRYGAWLASLPVVVKIGRTVFLHGSLSPDDAALGIDHINDTISRELGAFLRLRGEVVRAGIVNDLSSPAEAFAAAEGWLRQFEMGRGRGRPVAEPRTVREFLDLRQSRYLFWDGPLWDRDLAMADGEYEEELEKTLRALDADRIVVGHTPTATNRVESRFANRVFCIDTGAGPAYGGRPSALQLDGGPPAAIYEHGVELFDASRWSDAEIESFLLSADVVHVEDIGTGVTRPKKVTLESNGVRMDAAFKTLDVSDDGVIRFDRGHELKFSDSYRYERAAYLLDRRLGLNMVPVTVIRRIDKVEGALILWIEDAITESERLEKGIEPSMPRIIKKQQDLANVFDALIYNADANTGNELITLDDWKLHLIDHSRSFRPWRQLPERFTSQRVTISRGLHAQLEALEYRELLQLLGPVLSKNQIKVILKRRDAILKRYEADRARYGEDQVFQD